jgi:hypothetical protein
MVLPSRSHGPDAAKDGFADVIALLKRPEGARIDELMIATGWQAHWVRAAMSGVLEGKLGHTIVGRKRGGELSYRIVNPALRSD